MRREPTPSVPDTVTRVRMELGESSSRCRQNRLMVVAPILMERGHLGIVLTLKSCDLYGFAEESVFRT